MKVKTMLITPAIARDFLKLNTRNRVISERWVNTLASEMANGRFKDTRVPIAFRASDGSLGNGQHRLLALIQANVTLPMQIWEECPDDVVEVMDMNKIRTVGHQLQLAGIMNANQMAGAARSIAAICATNKIQISLGMCRLIIQEYSHELEFVYSQVRGFRPANRVWCTGCLAFALAADRNCEPFIRKLISGEELKKGDPALTLRNWLMSEGSLIVRGHDIPKMECVLNAAYNACVGEKITLAKRGVIGRDYFIGKRKRWVAYLREQLEQQL